MAKAPSIGLLTWTIKRESIEVNIVDYFDQVKIISRVSRKDRRDDTVLEFSKNELPINTNKVSFFDAITPTEANGFPNPGSRGCFLSHMRVLEDANQLSLSNILILEDDIQFSKHISMYGALAAKSLKNIDWDIAYFGHTLEDSTIGAQWLEVDSLMHLSHFYAVNQKTFEKITVFLNQLTERPAGHPRGGPMHYDGALNTFIQQNSGIKAVYFSVNLGYQRPSKTDIHELSILDTTPILRKMTLIARRLKAKLLRVIR
jgi:GR25 family glycosyltransferase involved in LPS biosynthesis